MSCHLVERLFFTPAQAMQNEVRREYANFYTPVRLYAVERTFTTTNPTVLTTTMRKTEKIEMEKMPL